MRRKIVLIVILLSLMIMSNTFAITQFDILSMTDLQIQALSDSQIEQYIKELEDLRGKTDPNTLTGALGKLAKERTRRNNAIDTGDFEPGGLTEEDYGQAFDMAKTIVTVLTTVGVVVSIMTVMILGIKYMIGSVEEKAEYKRTMIPILIGAALIFTSSTLVAIIYEIVAQIKV